jgi:hypothetical protein
MKSGVSSSPWSMSLHFVASVETETRLMCTRSGLSDLAFVLFGAAGYGLISHAVSPDTGEAVAKGEVKQSSFVLPILTDRRERATSTCREIAAPVVLCFGLS